MAEVGGPATKHEHDFKDEYYGYRCECGVFYAYGSAPWDDEGEYREDDDGEIDFDCGMTSDGFCTKAGSEECDWECPYSDEL